MLTIYMIKQTKTENGILPVEVIKNGKPKGLLPEVLLMGAVLNICFAYLPACMVREFSWTANTSGEVLLLYIVTPGIAGIASSFANKDTGRTFGWGRFLLGCAVGAFSFFSHLVSLFLLSNILMGIGMLSGTVLGVIQPGIEMNSESPNGIAHLMRDIGGTSGVSALQISLLQNMGLFPAGLLLFGAIALITQIFIVMRRRIC